MSREWSGDWDDHQTDDDMDRREARKQVSLNRNVMRTAFDRKRMQGCIEQLLVDAPEGESTVLGVAVRRTGAAFETNVGTGWNRAEGNIAAARYISFHLALKANAQS